MRFLAIFLVLTASTAAAQPRVPTGLGAPFLGGVPSGVATPEPLSLTVIDAINRSLEHNLGVINAEDSVEKVRGTRLKALADLLPNASGRVSEARQVVNLAAFGFPLPQGVPTIVGPFDVFDARISVSQSVFDLRALNDARAETHNVAAAQYTVKSARDLVVLVSGSLYLQALASAARADSAKAQLESADAIYRQISSLKDAGMVPGLDVLRAEVQLATVRQRATSAQNEFEKSKLQLARVIGLPAGQEFTLVDQLPSLPAPDMNLQTALDRAYRTRPDYQAALERIQAAESSLRAARGELLPSVRVDANYGAIGLTVGSAHDTYALVGSVNVPIFNGGRTRGHVAEAAADLRARQAEADDLKAGIYYDVKTAFLDLQATAEQLEVATRARDLSNQALGQARDRLTAGVSTNVEVIQAQEAVATASEQYITALYGYNLAKGLLARGIGVAEDAARQFLGGSR